MGVAVTVVLLACVVAYVVWLAATSGGAIRLRNALLLQPGEPGDFDWTPDRVPPGFAVERSPPDERWLGVVAGLELPPGALDWDRALALAGHLVEHARDLGPIQSDPWHTYQRIRAGHGYCADFVRVYLALAPAARLFARQWAFSFDGFGGHGHTIVEVFDRQRGRWAFIDVFNNFHAIAASGEPATALEFRAFAAGLGPTLAMQPNGPGRAGYPDPDKALDYYRRGAAEWYLWWGNAVAAIYRHPAVRLAGVASRRLGHLAANLVGVQPRIRTYPDPASQARTVEMLELRRRLLGAAVFAVLLGVALTMQLAFGGGGSLHP